MPEPRILTKHMIKQIFDGSAKSYDRVGPSIFSQFGKRLVEHMNLARGTRVLDVATGKGAVLLPAARRVGSKGHVTGIDLVYARAEDCWDFVLTLPPGATISRMSEETRARFEELLPKIRAVSSKEDGLHLSVGATYTLAKR